MIRIGARDVSPRDCEQCKRPFVPAKGSAGRFCSRQCSGACRTANKEKFYCAWCGNMIEHQIVRSEGYKYYCCSTKCVALYRDSRRPSIADRYWENVSRDGHPKGCWIWTSFVDRKGYGRINTKDADGKKHFTLAHRLSWEIHNGPIPDGLYVLHKCDVPLCSNPEHLFLGTQRDNMQDCIAKGRKSRGKQCSFAKLTEEQVVEIRRRYAEGGTSQQSLAQEFNVSRGHVQAIITRKTWAHVI